MTDTDEAVERAERVHKLELDARGAACVCGWQSDEPFVDEAVDEYVAHALAAADGGEVERLTADRDFHRAQESRLRTAIWDKGLTDGPGSDIREWASSVLYNAVDAAALRDTALAALHADKEGEG